MEKVVKEVLQLGFRNQEGRITTLRIHDPKEDLTSDQILEAMNGVIEKGIFTSSGGDFVIPATARIVETITDEFDIDVNDA